VSNDASVVAGEHRDRSSFTSERISASELLRRGLIHRGYLAALEFARVKAARR